MSYEQLTLFPNTNKELILTLKEFIKKIEIVESNNQLLETKVDCQLSKRQLIRILKTHEF